MERTVLQLKNITKIYPGTAALQHVDLEISSGEIHGIIGKNGAGKSTLVGIISGMIHPSSGEVIVNGRRVAHLSRIDAKKEHIAIVPQEPQIIADFTVAENLFLGDYPHKGPVVDWKEMFIAADKLLKKAGLFVNPRGKAGELSLSAQQLLLLLKACYVENAQIIILDEASASLAQDDEKIYYEIISEQKKMGKTIILISHRTDEILKVCDRVTVIRDGKTISTINCADLDKKSFAALIVGEESNERSDKMNEYSEKDPGLKKRQTILEVKGLTRAGAYYNINFQLHKTEILGFAGLRGSGRTEIMKSLIGMDHYDEGAVQICGMEYLPKNPAHALELGIVYLPEDRELEGIFSSLSVRENIMMNSLEDIGRKFIIDREKEHKTVQRLVRMFEIQAATPEQEVSQLSGGNKQKVVVGRIAAFGPKVFLLDEPTRGIDIAAKESMLSIIRNKLSADSGIIITSPGLEDLMLICDRILVLCKGKITASFDRTEFDEQAIFHMMQADDSREREIDVQKA